jgi:hypothetical protein
MVGACLLVAVSSESVRISSKTVSEREYLQTSFCLSILVLLHFFLLFLVICCYFFFFFFVISYLLLYII